MLYVCAGGGKLFAFSPAYIKATSESVFFKRGNKSHILNLVIVLRIIIFKQFVCTAVVVSLARSATAQIRNVSVYLQSAIQMEKKYAE